MPVLIAAACVTQCISQDSPAVSVYCTSTYVSVCTQPGMGLLFRSCRAPPEELITWRGYLHSLRAGTNLAENLTRRRSNQLSLAFGLLRASESIGRRSEDLVKSRGAIDVQESASVVAATTTGFAVALLDFHDSVDFITRG